MRFFCNPLNILIIISFLAFIGAAPSYERYTTTFLDKIHIGSKSKEISLILNTLTSKSTLFTNSKRPYAQEIQKGRKSDVLIDKINFEGQTIQSFPFNLGLDESKLNNQNIQGEFGFGIDSDNSNDLIDTLYDNGMLSSKVIELDLEEGGKENTFALNLNPKTDDFTFCDLSSKRFLDSDDYYYESWICEISHILMGSTKDQLVWHNGVEVKGQVAFDSRTKYVYIPKNFMNYIATLWKINTTDCKIIHRLKSDEKFFSCSLKTKKKIFDMPSIYFVIGGYGFRLRPEDLFENNGKNLICLIRFFNYEKSLWVLGVPFLREYNTVFDYDYAKIGFKGGDILNFKDEYEKWTHEVSQRDKSTSKKSCTWEKIWLIVGAIIGILIIIYVMFWLYRNCNRERPKYHIELNEQYDKKEFYH